MSGWLGNFMNTDYKESKFINWVHDARVGETYYFKFGDCKFARVGKVSDEPLRFAVFFHEAKVLNSKTCNGKYIHQIEEEDREIYNTGYDMFSPNGTSNNYSAKPFPAFVSGQNTLKVYLQTNINKLFEIDENTQAIPMDKLEVGKKYLVKRHQCAFIGEVDDINEPNNNLNQSGEIIFSDLTVLRGHCEEDPITIHSGTNASVHTIVKKPIPISWSDAKVGKLYIIQSNSQNKYLGKLVSLGEIEDEEVVLYFHHVVPFEIVQDNELLGINAENGNDNTRVVLPDDEDEFYNFNEFYRAYRANNSPNEPYGFEDGFGTLRLVVSATSPFQMYTIGTHTENYLTPRVIKSKFLEKGVDLGKGFGVYGTKGGKSVRRKKQTTRRKKSSQRKKTFSR